MRCHLVAHCPATQPPYRTPVKLPNTLENSSATGVFARAAELLLNLETMRGKTMAFVVCGLAE